jgi:hypothetical protein
MTFGTHCAKKEQVFLPGNAGAWSREGGLMARLQAAIETLVPLGYEDETGFHFQEDSQARAFRSKHRNGTWETWWF